jgi:CMP-N-acetylneuraminic acid synthetase
MNIAAIIPARLGSNRLENKNILYLGDKPLLFWSIDTALESSCFKYIVVSSESDKVLDLVRCEYSSKEVQTIKRPNHLATDNADLMDVCKHFLGKFQDVEFLFLMMPTYPLRKSSKIKKEILPPLYSRQVDRIVSVLPENFSTFDYWIGDSDCYKRIFKHAPLWCGTGNATYSGMRSDYYYKDATSWPYLIGERTLRVQTDYEEAIDIDTAEDLALAEKVINGYRLMQRGMFAYVTKKHEVICPEGVRHQSLLEYLNGKGINIDHPVLILKDPPPFFTFLRTYECNMSREYYSEMARKIIFDLPNGGHSQDFPKHYIHSNSYRILRIPEDSEGIMAETVPKGQVVFVKDLKQWSGYKEPYKWVKI